MSKTPYQHDAAYKNPFTDPEMVASLCSGALFPPILSRKWISPQPDPFPADLVTAEDRRESERNDIVWRVRLKESFCYLPFLLEFQRAGKTGVDGRPHPCVYRLVLAGYHQGGQSLWAGDRLPPVFPSCALQRTAARHGKRPQTCVTCCSPTPDKA